MQLIVLGAELQLYSDRKHMLLMFKNLISCPVMCMKCLMPETVTLLLEDVSEEALKERIHLRRVTDAVDMYDQLLQAGEQTHVWIYVACHVTVTQRPLHQMYVYYFISPGTAVSMETAHDLLDLICLYCDRDPVQEGGPQSEGTVSHS